MKRNAVLAVLTALTLMVAAPSRATLTVFTDRASWEASVGGSDGIENFNGVTPFSMSSGVNAAGLIDIGISGDPTDNRIDDGTGGADTDGSNYFHGALDFSGAASSDRVTLLINRPIIGFGADWATTITGGELFMMVGGDTVLFTDYFSGRGDGFLGVIATAAFSSVLLDTVLGTAEQFGMDDFTFKTTVAEPATLSLVAIGMLLGARRRRGGIRIRFVTVGRTPVGTGGSPARGILRMPRFCRVPGAGAHWRANGR